MSGTSPWAPSGPVASLVESGEQVTLVEGSCFSLSDRAGDIHPDLPQGVFLLDSRILSCWQLLIDGMPLEALAAAHEAPYQATFLSRIRPTAHQADSELIVFRHRFVGSGMREQITIENHGNATAHVAIALRVGCDFADLFAVKESRVTPAEGLRTRQAPDQLQFERDLPWTTRRVTISFSSPGAVQPAGASWAVELPPKGRWELCAEVALTVDDTPIEPRFRCGVPDQEAEPHLRLQRWRAGAPVLDTDHPALARAVGQAVRDLGALRIFDPEHPDDAVVAAGAPWFMTLFGRDSLLSSWMALIVDPSLATGVVETLARLQGADEDDDTEEEPGKILHEVRFGRASSLALGGGSAYYGSVDATPLFVMLLGELRRWGLADDVVERLLPHADRALAWLDGPGDRDGDGYIEYERRSPQGLANQGWKDSWDGINFADGRLPEPPIALCEVQGYTYAAYLARAHFAIEAGDQAKATHYRNRAAALKHRFNRDFWLGPDRGFAVGLDGHKEPIDALASNMGHCLWTGIVDEDKAPAVADLLLSDEMFSGWGVRTLATSMVRYNPVSYHNGSVWPHDNALIAAGLMRYGFVAQAHRVIDALLDVSATLGRLPELFAGVSRTELAMPAAYPASCSPQAWAAATPLLFLRSLLRLDPWVPSRRVHVAPVPLHGTRRLGLDHVHIGGRDVALRWNDGAVTVSGLDGLALDLAPRSAMSTVLPAPRAG